MNFRAFKNLSELEEFCNEHSREELAEIIQRGHEEYDYKTNPQECAFSKYELELMRDYMDDNM